MLDFYRCYAGTFDGARRKFAAAASRVDAQISQYTHPTAKGPADEILAIDVAHVGNPHAPRQCLVISGTHGQEGFAGSAAQIAWLLSGGPADLPADVGVLLIHGLNPYGFAYWSRTTENNVDLNRNFLDHGTPYPPNPHYPELHPHIIPPDWTREAEKAFDDELARFSAAHGADLLYNTLQAGQYTHPDGVIYGGRGREWSNLALERIIADHLSDAGKVGFIDWHTGIGGYGNAFFLCFHEPESEEFEQAARWWGRGCIENQRPHGLSRPNYTGLVFHGLKQFLGDRPLCGAVVEFGTRGIKMRRAIRLDLWLRTHGEPGTDQYELLRADMADAFCPADCEWREATVDLGVRITDQAVRGLAMW